MPKHKKAASSSSDSDEGPIDRNPPEKKPKPSEKKSTTSSKSGEESWLLDGKKFVRLSHFKGRTYVDIREFYEKNGELLPGKKGISLQPEQWRKLLSLGDEITEAMSNSC